LNYGLSFLSKHKSVGKALDTLTNNAKKAGLPYTVETFDILIKNAMELNDFESIQNLFGQMKSMQIVPGPSTWAGVLRAARTLEIRYEITDYMIVHDLVQSPEAKDEVAVAMIQLATPRLKDNPETFLKLEQSLEKVVGEDWPTPEVVNRLLKISVHQRLWDLPAQIIDMAIRKSVVLKPASLYFLFQLLQRGNRLNESLELFQSPVAKAIGIDDSSVIPLLFLTAWKAHSWNVCRVLWHYAASRAIISYSMQKLVRLCLMTSADRPSEQAPDAPQKLTVNAMAKIIPGTDLDIEEFDLRFPRLTAAFGSSDPVQYLSHWTPDDGTRREQRALAYTIMHRDLNAWKRYMPMSRKYLFQLLDEASKRDQEDHLPGQINRSDLMKLHKEMIPIEMATRVGLGQRRPAEIPHSGPRLKF